MHFHKPRFLLIPVALALVGANLSQPQYSAAASGSKLDGGPANAPALNGTLSFRVVVVDDLTPHPVPLTDFTISGGDGAVSTVRTDAEGVLETSLAPGSYTIRSVRPVNYKSRVLNWTKSFDITAGEATKIELTDADAEVSTAPVVTQAHQVSEEAQVYERVKSGVPTVECDFGSGSGFVVDRSGLVLTAQHVTNGTRWVALRFGRGLRVEAAVVEEDKDADVSVLRFNPQAVPNFAVLPLADVSHGPAAVVGEKVLAIGSPLHQEQVLTTGIVSKVEDSTLISDVNANHGNSGGPLMDLDGRVIGLVTFLDSTANGPGISGIVAIQKALPVLERARKKLDTVPMPAAEPLPDVSPVPVPDEALDEAANKDLKPIEIKKPNNFETLIYTPLTIASMEATRERELNKGRERRRREHGSRGVQDESTLGPTRYWERYAVSTHDAVVPIVVRPALKETSKSFWGNIASVALFGVASQRQLRFRDDFYDMELYRGGKLVQPVRRNRDTVDALYEDLNVKVKDTAYGGIYCYDPSAFEPGEPVVLKIRKESDLQKWSEVPLSEKEQQQIWDSFTAYRVALASAKDTHASEH